MSAFADARFRRLLLGAGLSRFGDSALYLSLGIWAKDLTGSNGAAGAIFLAQGLPSLLAPLTGHWVDRTRRRPLLIALNAAAGLAVLSLLLVRSRTQLWLLYAFAVYYGATLTVQGPAQAALIRDLLADADLASANAAFATLTQGLRIASPLVGAALYTTFGGGSLALFDAATFAVAVVMTAAVRVTESPIPPADQMSTRDTLLVGERQVRSTPILRQMVRCAVAAMLVLGFYESLTFAVVGALGRPPSFFGVLMSVQAVGSIVGGLLAARLTTRLGEPRTLGVALALWAVASLTYTVPRLPVAFAALVVFGSAVPLYAVALSTATQRYAPPRLQGRTGSAVTMATTLSQTLSIAVGAALVDAVSYRLLLVIVAAVAATAALPILARPALATAPTDRVEPRP